MYKLILLNILSLLLVTSIIACNEHSSKMDNTAIQSKEIDTTINSTKIELEDETLADNIIDDEMETFYVVVVDTSTDYYLLNSKMYLLNQQVNIPIDTMGRHFNKTKNLITLPDNDEDEIYAGNYFPRRFPSLHLSLEYFNFYQSEAGENIIALVAGILEAEKSADSLLTILHQIDDKSFTIKAEIYMGCMH